jgi:DNA polymerase-3 subunit alpha/error-prone DNA polymerase
VLRQFGDKESCVIAFSCATSIGIILTPKSLLQRLHAFEMPQRFSYCSFDMHVAEAIGLKFDILSQRGIGHIDDTVKLVAKIEASK